MSPIWYVLIGFVLGQGSYFIACYIGEIIHDNNVSRTRQD